MSLTSMIKGKREIDIELQNTLRDIIPKKQQFCTFSGTEAFSSKKNIEAPYNLSNPYHASVVGTAFDYMARFIVSQKINRNREDVTEGLTSVFGLMHLIQVCDKKTSKSLETKFDNGINLVNKFINHSEMKFEEILSYASYFARLEHIYRSGVLPKDIKGSLLGKEESEVIEDLKRLCKVFIDRFMIPQIITAESNVVFNPAFGIASISCGGADADIYIDGTLFDFKTSKQTGYKWQEVAQIFGYYFLNCIADQLKDTSAKLNGLPIKKLAFYKARYGEIEFIDISTMDTEKMELTSKKINNILRIPSKELLIKDLPSKELPSKELPLRSERYNNTNKKVKNNLFKKLLSLLGFKI